MLPGPGFTALASILRWLLDVRAIPMVKYFEYHCGPNPSPRPAVGPLRGTDAWPDLLLPQDQRLGPTGWLLPAHVWNCAL